MRTIDEQTKSALYAAFNDGMGVRAAARFAGVHKTTASRYLRMLDPLPLCKCGRPVTHQGWCAHRFANSEKRQRFMGRWTGALWKKHAHSIKCGLHALRRNCEKAGNPDGVKLANQVLMDLFGTTDWP